MAVVRFVGKAIVAALFACLMMGALWAFYNGFAMPVMLGTGGLVMAGALAIGSNARERILILSTVVAAILGGWAGHALYFQMFSFQWFHSVFNGKDLGPLGLILFVCLGAFLPGLLCEVYLSRWLKIRSGIQDNQPPTTPLTKNS